MQKSEVIQVIHLHHLYKKICTQRLEVIIGNGNPLWGEIRKAFFDSFGESGFEGAVHTLNTEINSADTIPSPYVTGRKS